MRIRALLLPALALLLAVSAPAGNGASALTIEALETPGGVTAWLAEDHHSPVVALRFAFLGGSAGEEREKAGITRVLARLLARGGSGPDRSAFPEQAQRIGLRVNFQAGRDALYGSIDLPATNLAPARDLLAKLFVGAPVGERDLDEVRAPVLAAIAEETADPRAIAADAWYAHVFTGHPYGGPSGGDGRAVAALGPGDVASLRTRLLTRRNVVAVAAGAVSARELQSLLDALLGALPAGESTKPAPPAFLPGPVVRISSDVDAASIVFGYPAFRRGHPDFSAARVLAHIVGSGDLDSRLLEELRLRRGLVYSAQLSLVHDRLASVMLGDIVTSPERAEAALVGLHSVLLAARSGGVGEDEVNSAKLALAGSDLIALDSNGRIADAMLSARLDGEELDFLERRTAGLRAVTTEQLRRVAGELLAPEKMRAVVVTGAGKQ